MGGQGADAVADVTPRLRVVAYGSAGLLLLTGAACGVAIAGETGQILALVLIGGGLVGLVGLVFMEVGLSEDRERAREQRRAERRSHPDRPRRGPPGRMRGKRRRLR